MEPVPQQDIPVPDEGIRARSPGGGRGIALTVLASAAVIFMFHWGRDVLIPIALAIFISYVLAPPVEWLKRRARIPKALGAAVILSLALGVLGVGIFALQPQADRLLDTVPQAAKKLDRELRRSALDKESAMTRMKQAAAELERAAASVTSPEPPRAGKSAPAAAPAETRTDRLFAIGTARLFVAGANALVVIALAYLLLVTGDMLKRRLIRVSGRTLQERNITVEILDEVQGQIQRYLVAHVGTSVLLGIATWIALVLIGLENAAFWGVAAGVLHLVPYIGPAVTLGLTGLVAYLQFGSAEPVLLVIGSQLAISCVIGLLLMPWLTERMTRINVVAIFISLLFWGWLWGVWGLLLGVPIMMAVQAVCARAEGLQAVAELLGRDPLARPAPAAEGGAVTGA